MFDIMHRVGVNASPRDVYNAITARDRLAGWWTADTRGQSEVGGVVHFQFGDRGFFDMKVLELQPAKRVVWEVTASSTRAGASRWTSWATAAPSGRRSSSASSRCSKPAAAPRSRTTSASASTGIEAARSPAPPQLP
jgi:uncharacterized protein YndB with AHSA1/START domain